MLSLAGLVGIKAENPSGNQSKNQKLLFVKKGKKILYFEVIWLDFWNVCATMRMFFILQKRNANGKEIFDWHTCFGRSF